ncbi:hypothetical protein BGZ65_004765 [Modicella reniformis]|uniref:Actin-related protein 10 n=1 Tax=Modicella reniformis TaxID=1440133 RepID=A0A9P6M2W2_9FUNG|nr:hypothetical protein BGZ65_004765 [Modicella reniformis]
MTLPLTKIRDLSFRTSIYGIEERIVLDIGSCYIKCGFSGESRPRQFISMFLSEEALDDYLGLRPVHRQHFGHECNEICNDRANHGCRRAHPLEYAELYELDFMRKCNGVTEEQRLKVLEERLSEYLYEVYFKHLLTDPKQRKVIVCESPLMPIVLKQTIAKVLFEKLQTPSVSFTNSHLLALLTTGITTGLVIDCGHLETSVLPIYASRPMMPFIQTTPRAGKFLSQHLKQLLREKCPVALADNPTDLRVTPERILTSAFLETIKTRLLFASPLIVNARDNIGEEEMNNNYRDMSTATEVHVEVWMEEEQARGIMAIPGWIRERASECLLQGDEDALSVTDVILETISKAPSDLRRPLINSMLLVGGTAQLPNLQNRLLQEIKRSIQTNPKWKRLGGLVDSVRFLDDLTAEDKASLSTAVGFLGGASRSASTMDLDSAVDASGSSNSLVTRETKEKKSSSKEKKVYQSSGKVFMPNCRTWIGGSLVGSLKVSGPEVLRENFNGTVPDWTTASLANTATATMASSTPAPAVPAYSHDVTPTLAISY